MKAQQYAVDHVLDFDENDNMVEVEEEEVQGPQRRKGKAPAIERGTSLPSSRGSAPGPIVSGPRKRGPMDAFFTPDPEIEVQKRKMRQLVISKKFDKEAIERTWQHIARWFYQAGIAFNAVTLNSFEVMLQSIGQFGPGLPPPSFHQMREPLLKKEVNATKAMMETHKMVWASKGCSLMSDGWTDRKDRTLINFLVNSPRGTVFIESIDASSYIKTGEKIFEMLSKMVERVGEKNIVQVITDNAANMKLAGKYLEQKFPQLYWTPCAAHCLDLILEDIGKLPIAKRTLKRAIQLSGFIYGHGYVLSIMRKFTKGRELLRPGMTRFATSFLTLASIHKQKHSLRTMFISGKWTTSRWSKEQKVKEATAIVRMPSFWNNIVFILKATSPLVRVLRLVDSEKKPAMGYIYEAMDRAKEAIRNAFNGNEKKYKDIFEIIDRRWDSQMHRPLHAAGYFLNPEFFYDNEVHKDNEVMRGLFNVIERFDSRCFYPR